MADLHNSRSWRITQPLRWLSLQRQLLRQEGLKCEPVGLRKILRKGMALSLVFSIVTLSLRFICLKVLRKTGCYTLLQRLFQRVMLVQSDTMMMQSRRYDVGTEEMTSRAMSIYNELKNKKYGEITMRIVIDLQGAQTESRFRGIGRYSIAIARGITRNNSRHEIFIALSAMLDESIAILKAQFADLRRQKI